MRIQRKTILIGALGIIALGALVWLAPAPPRVAADLPREISDESFWQMVSSFSEAGGSFRSDNFVSNERQFQWVVSELKQNHESGGVYLGVGPDQNFTYLVALEPKIAFIIDIRRQNMLQHLMYKALVEMSTDRVDFLSRLFSRKPAEGLSAEDSVDNLLQAIEAAPRDEKLFDENLETIIARLVQHHHFNLSDEDVKSITYVYHTFFEAGPELTYTFGAGQGAFGGRAFGGWRSMPSYAQLMTETDEDGHNRSYLASGRNFRILQDLEKRNVVVPLVGDFAGNKTLRAVGAYLHEHNTTVTAFYTSNVEQYLFQQGDDWSNFYKNVGTLPIDSKSTFIRSVASGRRYQTVSARASLLSPIAELLKEFRAGRLDTYYEVIRMSH